MKRFLGKLKQYFAVEKAQNEQAAKGGKSKLLSAAIFAFFPVSSTVLSQLIKFFKNKKTKRPKSSPD